MDEIEIEDNEDEDPEDIDDFSNSVNDDDEF